LRPRLASHPRGCCRHPPRPLFPGLIRASASPIAHLSRTADLAGAGSSIPSAGLAGLRALYAPTEQVDDDVREPGCAAGAANLAHRLLFLGKQDSSGGKTPVAGLLVGAAGDRSAA